LGPPWANSPLRYPPERDERKTDRQECKISTPLKLDVTGAPGCCSPSQQSQQSLLLPLLLLQHPQFRPSLSSSVGRRGQGAGPPGKQFPHPHRPEPCDFQHQSILNLTWPRLACLELHHPKRPPPPLQSPDRPSYPSTVACSSLLFHRARNYFLCSTVATMREIISVNGRRTLCSPPLS
jgi:hypothetical protein